MNDFRLLAFGLRVLHGAWGQVSPAISRVGETDEEIHDLWTKIDEGLSDLDRLVRKRMRDQGKTHAP